MSVHKKCVHREASQALTLLRNMIIQFSYLQRFYYLMELTRQSLPPGSNIHIMKNIK